MPWTDIKTGAWVGRLPGKVWLAAIEVWWAGGWDVKGKDNVELENCWPG